MPSPNVNDVGFTPGGNTTLSVSNSSSNVALPSSDPTCVVTNTGTVTVYIAFGMTSSVVATTAGFAILPQQLVVFNVSTPNGSYTYLAGITVSSTATLDISTGNGSPQTSGGPISGTISASNPSVGTNAATAPGSSTQIGSVDGSGNLQPASSTNPLPVTASAPSPDSTQVTGTISANGDSVILNTNGGYSSFGVTVTGTGSGAIQIQGSQDGTNFAVTTALPLANGVASNVISANGTYQGNMGGLKSIKLVGLSIVSGTYNIKISAGVGISSIMQDNIPWVTGGYSTGSSSTAIIDTVKAASTSAAATDTSRVVQESPNSPLIPAQGSTTSTQHGPLVQGAVTTANPSYTTGQTNPLSLGTDGGLRTEGTGSAGTAASGVVTVQGIASMTPVQVSQATASSLNAQVVGAAASGSAVSGNPVLIAGSDGTDVRTISTETSGHVDVAIVASDRVINITKTFTPGTSYATGNNIGGLFTFDLSGTLGSKVSQVRLMSVVLVGTAATVTTWAAVYALPFLANPSSTTFTDGSTPTIANADGANTTQAMSIAFGSSSLDATGYYQLATSVDSTTAGGYWAETDSTGKIYIALLATGTVTLVTPAQATLRVTFAY